jgi:hypothetical protein
MIKLYILLGTKSQTTNYQVMWHCYIINAYLLFQKQNQQLII